MESLRYDDGKLQEMHRMLANALNAYTNLGSRRCTCEPNFAAGAGLTIEGQHVSPRFARQVEPTTAADTLKIVLLGDEVSFDCAVESADVTEVSIWWQKDEANLTISDEEKYSLKVTKEKLLFSVFLFQIQEFVPTEVCKNLGNMFGQYFHFFSRLTKQARVWYQVS